MARSGGSARARFLVLRLAVCLGLGLVPGCRDEAARLEDHKERGDAYFEEGKYAEAIIEYKSALKIDPNDASAHYGLARSHLGEKQLRRAYWELEETVRLDPANSDARLQYGEFLVLGRQEDLEKALELARAVETAEPDRVEAYLLEGRALQSLGRPEEAQQAFEKAVEVGPDQGAPLLWLANFHRRQKNREAAEPLFRRLTEVEPSFVSYAALGGFLAEDRAHDQEAEASFRKALELAEEDRRVVAYQTLSSFYFGRERYEEAERTLREGVEASGGDLDLIYLLARFYHSRGETDRADQVIEEATRAKPDDVKPYLVLSTYRGRQGDPEGALEAAEAALRVDPESRAARLRKAELLVDLGYRAKDATKMAQGKGIVDAILAREESDPEALFVRSKIEMAESRFADAVASLRRAIDTRPDWAQAHFLLGSALFASGDRPEARAELVRALELDADLSDARRVLAQVQASLGEQDQAIEEARRILRARPEDVRTRILLAQSLVKLGRLDEGLAELEAIPEEGRDAEVHYAIGRVHYFRGDRDEARVHLGRALEAEPHHAEVLGGMLRLDAQQGRLEESLARMRAAVEAEPDEAKLRQLLGMAQYLTGRPSEAEESFRKAIELDPNDLSAYQGLAQLLGRTGRAAEVVATYERALAARPDSAGLHLILGILKELRGQPESAIEHYEAAIRLEPELAPAKNNLAYLLAERGEQLERALDLAQEAKALLPDNANAADTLGWVLYKKNIPSAAIGYLKEAEGKMPPEDRDSLGLIRQHLALAYEANGEPSESREVIERALAAHEEFAAAHLERTGEAPPEPSWAGELRSLRDRLPAAPGA